MPVPAALRIAADDPRVVVHGYRPVRTGGEFVLYWMQIYRRPSDNLALAYATLRANELGIPCVVYEALRPDYPFASDRFHAFVLEGARDVARGLAERGILHRFFLPRSPADAKGVLATIAARAALVVTDDYPSFIIGAQTAALANRASCAVVAVDDNAVVPLALLPRMESAARTIRPKILSALGAWLRPLEEIEPRCAPPGRLDLPFEPIDLARCDVAKLVASCAIDHDVPAVAEFPGGQEAALARAMAFARTRLPGYAQSRNDPSRPATSHLSPYLHFGMISARKVALLAQEAGEDHGVRESTDAFLEQLLVRRGLAYNFARHAANHTRYEAIPGWAQKTLAEHTKDARPKLLTLEELTQARSPDPLWNAAQLELRTRGVVQGYARMLWGKLPITWMQSPAHAHEALVHLNDRFALDGRDPDGYANIGWCFGLHDRPWPNRPIFGTVRAMTSQSARRKLDFEDYIAQAARWRMELG